jgi:nucleoside-diphosphate-sugar epimerase
MRILVTGATGFIGYELSRQLATAGRRPRLMVSRPQRGRLLTRLDAELVQGDLTRPASLSRAVRGMDAVIHLAARATFEDLNSLRPTIVDGTVALAKAAAEARVKSFVHASSLLVYGNSRDSIDQQTAAAPRLDYGRAKLEAEAALTEIAEQSGMSLAVVRLPHVYGARDLMFEQIRGGRLILPGQGLNTFAHLHVEDCGRLLAAAAEQGWTGVTPVGDEESVNWREFIDVVREHYPRFRVLWAPAWLARAGTEILAQLLRWRAVPSLLTPGAVIGFNLNLPVRSNLLWEDLGLEPSFPTIREGIPDVLDDCVAFRWQHPVLDRKGWS